MPQLEANYQEQYLLPPALEDWIPLDHPVRFLREVVDQLDLTALGFKDRSTQAGRPSYSEKLLLRVLLYGYWRRYRSFRQLEFACANEIGFIWLCGRLRPDHNTLWRFFHDHKKALQALFRRTVKAAAELGLVGFVLQAVDGTKIPADVRAGRYDAAHLEKILQRLDRRVEELEAALEAARTAEAAEAAEAAAALPPELQSVQALREKVKGALERVQSGDKKHCHPTDPEAQRMAGRGRAEFGYNAQAVVDESHRIVVAQDVLAAADDYGCLAGMAEQANENTDQRPQTLVADAGYLDSAQLAGAESAADEVLVPLLPQMRNDEGRADHKSCFVHQAESDTVRCPQGRELPFLRERVRKGGRKVREYGAAAVCRECPVRAACTRARNGRVIELYEGHEAVERLRRRLQEEAARERLRRRGRTVELMFAWIKAGDGFRRWTVRGLENARAQWALVCAVRNWKSIYKKWREERKPGAQGSGRPWRRSGLALRSLVRDTAFFRSAPLGCLFAPA